jgi:hypothetical protein
MKQLLFCLFCFSPLINIPPLYSTHLSLLAITSMALTMRSLSLVCKFGAASLTKHMSSYRVRKSVLCLTANWDPGPFHWRQVLGSHIVPWKRLYPCRYQTTVPKLYQSSFIHYEMHTVLTHTDLNQIKTYINTSTWNTLYLSNNKTISYFCLHVLCMWMKKKYKIINVTLQKYAFGNCGTAWNVHISW